MPQGRQAASATSAAREGPAAADGQCSLDDSAVRRSAFVLLVWHVLACLARSLPSCLLRQTGRAGPQVQTVTTSILSLTIRS